MSRPSITITIQLLALLLVLSGTSSAVHNDGTETINSQPSQDVQEEPTQDDSNQARRGGRTQTEPANNGPDQSQVGCRELRSTKYISDGQCTSVNPIKELVCAGECLPAHLLPNWIGSRSYTGRYWSRREAQEWRCVIDRTRTQRIRLQCQDGSSRTYKITVVTSCKCKRYSREQNVSANKEAAAAAGAAAAGAAGGGGKQRKHQKKAGHGEEPTAAQPDN